MKINKRDLEFIFEIGSLKNMPRGWRQHLAMDCASISEHIFRVMWLALIIARHEGVKNEEKILKMALVHDLVETRLSDHSYIQKVYIKENEHKVADDMFTGTILGDFNKDILREYNERKSLEAKIVKDADNLDVDLELKELEEAGSQLRKKWRIARKKVRYEKLYTQTAKRMWDLIQKVDVADWHLNSNKWFKIPTAGK